jgi:hypothetical protein
MLRSCQSKQFRVWRKRGKKRKSTPSALSPKRTKVLFGKKVPRKSLFPRKVFGPKRHRWTPKNQFESQISPFPESKGERSKPAFSRKNRSKRKERPLPHSASLTDQLFSCARAAREALRVEFSERRDLAEREREKKFSNDVFRRNSKEKEKRMRTFFVLDLRFHVIDGVRRLHL